MSARHAGLYGCRLCGCPVAGLKAFPAWTGRGRIPLRPVDEAAMAKALSGNTAVRPINARPGGP